MIPNHDGDAEGLARSSIAARKQRLQVMKVFEAYGVSCDELRVAVDQFASMCQQRFGDNSVKKPDHH
jgi:hypothetical protein